MSTSSQANPIQIAIENILALSSKTKYVLQLSKGYEYFDQAYKGEIIAYYEFDDQDNLERKVALHIVNNP